MGQINKQALKEKLAERVGFEYKPDLPYYHDEIKHWEDGSYIQQQKQIGYWVKGEKEDTTGG